MTSAPEATDPTVQRLDDDVQMLLVMLTSIRATQLRHDNRLEEIDRSIAELGSKVDRLLALLER